MNFNIPSDKEILWTVTTSWGMTSWICITLINYSLQLGFSASWGKGKINTKISIKWETSKQWKCIQIKGTKKSIWKLNWYILTFMDVYCQSEEIMYVNIQWKSLIEKDLHECENLSVKFPCALLCINHQQISFFFQWEFGPFVSIFCFQLCK